MPTFTYRGVNAAGGQIRAEITAVDERTAARQLRAQGITVQNLTAKRGTAGAGIDLSQLPLFRNFIGGVRGEDVAVCSRQVATMVAAGLPLVLCVQTLGVHAVGK